MTTFRKYTNVLPLSAILRNEMDVCDMKVETLAKLLTISDDRAYDVLAGAWDEKTAKWRHVARKAPAAIANAWVYAHLAETQFAMPVMLDLDGDLNRDGRVTTADVEDGLFGMLDTCMSELKQIRDECAGSARSLECTARSAGVLLKINEITHRLMRANAATQERRVG